MVPHKLRNAMAKAGFEIPIGATFGDLMVEVAFRAALRSTESGNSTRREIREAIEGRAPTRVELHQNEQYEIKIVWEKPVQRRIEEKAIEADVVKQLPPGEPEADDDSRE